MCKTWADHALHLPSCLPCLLIKLLSQIFSWAGGPHRFVWGLRGSMWKRGRGSQGSCACGSGEGLERPGCECFPEELQSCTLGYAWFVQRTSNQLVRRGEVCEPGLGETMALGQMLEGLEGGKSSPGGSQGLEKLLGSLWGVCAAVGTHTGPHSRQG